LPLDHFFFCFLPPVAEGACHEHILVFLSRRMDLEFALTILSVGVDGSKRRGGGGRLRRYENGRGA
jgi:hypothetical protein